MCVQQRLQRWYAVVSGDDSHDDFKPKYKAEPVDDVTTTIEGDIKGNEVFIYMKVCGGGVLPPLWCCGDGHRPGDMVAAAVVLLKTELTATV